MTRGRHRRAQKELLDALGVARLAAVVGPSFGAYQSFQWAVSYPDMIERVAAAVGAPWHPGAPGTAHAILASLVGAPGWEAWTRATATPCSIRCWRCAPIP
jgi:homoserine O-acetyltransferase